MVHTGGGRRRGKSRPRILYWFRTPPGVRIGRSALDESAIRLIEEHNPDVEFDWTRILKGQDAPVEPKPPQQDRRGKSRPREFTQRPPAAPIKPPPEIERADQPSTDFLAPATPEPAATLEPAGESLALADTVLDGSSPADANVPLMDPDVPSRSIEAEIAELLSDPIAAPAPHAAEGSRPTTPAEARLGSEGLSRLRARHAEVLARISEAVTDPVRREELKSQADRLNPDTWVTDAEVTAGLEAYETVFESLRTVVGRRGGRRRRRSGRPKGQAGSPGPQQADPSLNSAGGEEGDAEDAGEDL